MDIKTIGFIGLGTMGGPMSHNLVQKSGCKVLTYDINAHAVEESVKGGAVACQDVPSLVSASEVIFTMLPKNEHVRSVFEQILPHVKSGQIFVEMSTISPSVSVGIAAKVREKGAVLIDAPVVKSKPAAIAGKLGIYVGGDKSVYEQVLPLLLCMGENVIHLGDNGAGLTMKLCHNMLVSQIQNGVNEMLTLAWKAGRIDPETFQKAASYGGAQNFYLDSKVSTIASENFAPAFAVEYMDKDVHLAKDLCTECGVDLKGVELAVSRYEAAMERGLGKLDFSATYLLFDK